MDETAPPSRSLSTRIAKALLRLFPAYPPKKPASEKTDLAKAERVRVRTLRLSTAEYEDEREGGFLQHFDPGVEITGDVVFDLGCGYGGRLVALAPHARRLALGLDVHPRMSAAAHRFAASRGVDHAAFVSGVGEALPFADDCIDAIVSYDVFEHVQDPERCLAECYRVLRPGGQCLLVFPPFYHPTGAHLDGYVSNLPYANVLFRDRVLLQAVDEILAERPDPFQPGPLREGDRLYWLNGMTVAGFEAMLARSPFEARSVRLLPLFSPINRKYEAWRMRYYAWAFAPLTSLPALRELFVHRIVAHLRKPG